MTKSLTRPLALLNLSPRAILSLLPWLLLLAWLASVAWFLTDDAFISFRYTRNLIEGHGLVFNPGERVEGYTNFLWILELAALWSHLRHPSRIRRPLALRRLHLCHSPRNPLVDRTPPLHSSHRSTRRLDDSRTPLLQRHLRRLDLQRRP